MEARDQPAKLVGLIECEVAIWQIPLDPLLHIQVIGAASEASATWPTNRPCEIRAILLAKINDYGVIVGDTPEDLRTALIDQSVCIS